MPEPSGRMDCGTTDSIDLIHESEEIGNKILEIMQKSGCSFEDLEKVSTMLTHVYLCGFEVGKRCVVK